MKKNKNNIRNFLVIMVCLVFFPGFFVLLVFGWILSFIAPLFEGTPSDVFKWWKDD